MNEHDKYSFFCSAAAAEDHPQTHTHTKDDDDDQSKIAQASVHFSLLFRREIDTQSTITT